MPLHICSWRCVTLNESKHELGLSLAFPQRYARLGLKGRPNTLGLLLQMVEAPKSQKGQPSQRWLTVLVIAVVFGPSHRGHVLNVSQGRLDRVPFTRIRAGATSEEGKESERQREIEGGGEERRGEGQERGEEKGIREERSGE